MARGQSLIIEGTAPDARRGLDRKAVGRGERRSSVHSHPSTEPIHGPFTGEEPVWSYASCIRPRSAKARHHLSLARLSAGDEGYFAGYRGAFLLSRPLANFVAIFRVCLMAAFDPKQTLTRSLSSNIAVTRLIGLVRVTGCIKQGCHDVV
jgi:hypothetical protein